jgi:hypothetical protein
VTHLDDKVIRPFCFGEPTVTALCRVRVETVFQCIISLLMSSLWLSGQGVS